MKPAEIALAIREAKRHERERCARLAERKAWAIADGEGEVYVAKAIAKAIRRMR